MAPKPKKEDGIIEKHVAEEVNQAFSLMPGDILRQRLEKRMKAEMKLRTSSRFWILKPLPLFSLVFLVAALGLIVFLLFSSSPSGDKTLKIIEQGLQATPGIQTLSRLLAESSQKELRPGYTLPWLDERLLKVISPHQGENASTPPKIPTPSEQEWRGLLDIKQKMEILIRDKALHQSFQQIIHPLEKEDRHGQKTVSFMPSLLSLPLALEFMG